MESSQQIQETEQGDNSLYEVIEPQHTKAEARVARLKEEAAPEREKRVRLLAEFDNY